MNGNLYIIVNPLRLNGETEATWTPLHYYKDGKNFVRCYDGIETAKKAHDQLKRLWPNCRIQIVPVGVFMSGVGEV